MADPSQLADAAQAYTLWALYERADIVVKAVMIGLLLASVWSWAVIVDKWLQIRSAHQKARKFEEAFWSGLSFDDFDDGDRERRKDPMAKVFAAAAREWRDARRSQIINDVQAGLVRERADRLMSAAIERENQKLEEGLGILATIAAATPFIGLFGTVWGIMNSFRSIAATGDTTLTVVAPGIAEALFATALGLLAAIPALVFYNTLQSQAGRYAARLETFADEVGARLSRRVQERMG